MLAILWGSVGQLVAKSDRNNCRVPNLVDASPLWEGAKVDTLPRSNGNTMLVAVGPTLPQEFFAISIWITKYTEGEVL